MLTSTLAEKQAFEGKKIGKIENDEWKENIIINFVLTLVL